MTWEEYLTPVVDSTLVTYSSFLCAELINSLPAKRVIVAGLWLFFLVLQNHLLQIGLLFFFPSTNQIMVIFSMV